MKCICPHVPAMPITIHLNMTLSSWFGITGCSPHSQEDESGTKQAAENANDLSLIHREMKTGIS